MAIPLCIFHCCGQYCLYSTIRPSFSLYCNATASIGLYTKIGVLLHFYSIFSVRPSLSVSCIASIRPSTIPLLLHTGLSVLQVYDLYIFLTFDDSPLLHTGCRVLQVYGFYCKYTGCIASVRLVYIASNRRSLFLC